MKVLLMRKLLCGLKLMHAQSLETLPGVPEDHLPLKLYHPNHLGLSCTLINNEENNKASIGNKTLNPIHYEFQGLANYFYSRTS